jgi:hypothetical protein
MFRGVDSKIPIGGPLKDFNDKVTRIFQGQAAPAEDDSESPATTTSVPEATTTTDPSATTSTTTPSGSDDGVQVITVQAPDAYGVVPPYDPTCN